MSRCCTLKRRVSGNRLDVVCVSVRLRWPFSSPNCRSSAVSWGIGGQRRRRSLDPEAHTTDTGVDEEMEQNQSPGAVLKVAETTTAAAHRRDHEHAPGEDSCHPHVVDVVHLGNRAVAVCHDCQADSGFLPHRRAETLALEHRRETAVTSVVLPLAAQTLRLR